MAERIEVIINGDSTDLVASTEVAKTAVRSLGRTVSDTNKTASGGIPSFDSLISKLQTVGVLMALPAAGALSSALTSGAAGALGLAAALGTLIGLLPVIAQGFLGFGQVLGTLFLAFNGISKALSAYESKQNAAGTAAQEAAKRSTSAAEAQKAAANSVAQAEQTLTSAHEQEKVAQDQLNLTLQEATRQFEDLQAAVHSTALEEESATTNLAAAHKAYQQVLADPTSTKIQIDQAREAVQRAEQDQQDAETQASRARQDYHTAVQEGVNGMPQVVAAQRSLQDAQTNVAHATEQLSYQQQQAKLHIDQANQSVKQASSQTNTYRQALAALTPAQRQFVQFLIPLKDKLDSLKQIAAKNLFPGLEIGIKAALKNLPAFKSIIGETGKALGGLGADFGKFIGSDFFKNFSKVIGATNVKLIRDFGKAMDPLAHAFGRIMEAAQPLVRFLGQMSVEIAKQFDEWTKGAKKSGALASFFDATRTTLTQLGRILGNLGHAFGQIFQSAYPLGHQLLSLFVQATHQFDKFVSSTKGKVFLASFFSQALPALKAFLGLVVGLGQGIITLASQAGPQLTQILQMLSQTVLPAVVKLLGELITNVAPGLINVLQKLLPILAKVLDAVGPALAKSLAKVIPVLAKTFLPLLKDLVPLAKVLAAAFKDLAPAINAFLKLVAPIMKGFAQQLRGIMQLIDGILTGNFSQAWKGVQNIFKGQIKIITGIFGALVKIWGGIAKTIGGAIGDAFSTAWKGIVTGFKDAWSAIKDVWHGVAGWLSGVFDKVKGAIESVIGFVQARISDLINAYNAIPLLPNVSNPFSSGAPSGPPAGPGGPVGPGGPGGRQRGGMVAGTGDGDKVPIMAEPGEGFINKRAVTALGGPAAIEAINRALPRFQKGGVVGAAGRGKWKPDGDTRKSLNQLKATDADIGILDEQIANAGVLSTAPDSPGGTDVTPAERKGLIGLNQKLLTDLQGKRGTLSSVLSNLGRQESGLDQKLHDHTKYLKYSERYWERLIKHAHTKQERESLKRNRDRDLGRQKGKITAEKGVRKGLKGEISTLKADLVSVIGVTGEGGRIFDVQRTLAQLGADQSRGTVLDQLEAGLAQAQLTPTLTDDIAWEQKIVDYWTKELARLKATGAPYSQISEAASSLQSAKSDLASLQDQGGGGRGTTLDGLQAAWDESQLTPALTDDLKAAQDLRGYWATQLASLEKAHAPYSEISDAAQNLKQWSDEVTSIQESVSGGGRGTLLDRLQLGFAKAQLTPQLTDDISWAQKIVGYWTDELAKRTKDHAPFADITEAANALKDARDQLASLQEDQSGGSGGGTNNQELIALLQDQLQQSRVELALSQGQYSVFSGFAKELKHGELGLPFLGAFANGIQRVGRTGLAILHKDETVTPDPEGPFGSMLGGRAVGGDGMTLNLYVDGDLAPFVGQLRAELDGREVKIIKKVDQRLGRSSRQLAFAPGR